MLAKGERACILVLGMHRSGTSALTRVISFLGATLPKNLMPPLPNDNDLGFWEPRDLWTLHNQMLAEADSRWDDWRKLDLSALPPDRLAHYKDKIGRLIVEEYGDARLIVLKEPRICRFVPFYISLLTELGYQCHCALALRDPLGVIASLGRRNGMTEGFAALLWLRHMLDAEAATRAMPRAILAYDALLADWQTTVGTLSSRLGVEWPHAASQVGDEIGNFLSKDLRHFAPSRHELPVSDAISDIVAWVRDAYDALLRVEHDPDDMAAYRVLDRVRDEFDAVSGAFGGALFPELAQRDKIFELERGRLVDEVARVRATVALRDNDVAQLRGDLSTRDQFIGEHQATLASKDQQLALVRSQCEEKEGVIRRLVPELEERQRVIEDLVRECEERLRVSEERRALIQRLTDALQQRDPLIVHQGLASADTQG